MLSFAYPWLLMLIALPLLLRWLLPAYRQTQAGVVVPFLDRLAALTGQQPASGAVVVRPPQIQQVCLWVVWLCIVLALARPQWLEKPVIKTLPTRELLLAVDLSGSTETQDFTNAAGQRVDRLTAVKEVLDDFLARRKGDRVGLIFFGSAAFVQAPFTEDLDACRSLLDEAQVRMAGPKTAFGDAIAWRSPSPREGATRTSTTAQSWPRSTPNWIRCARAGCRPSATGPGVNCSTGRWAWDCC